MQVKLPKIKNADAVIRITEPFSKKLNLSSRINLEDKFLFAKNSDMYSTIFKIIGTFTKEDIKKVEELCGKYKKKPSIETLFKQYCFEYEKLFDSIHFNKWTDINTEQVMYEFSPEKISEKSRKALKEKSLEIYALNKLKHANLAQKSWLTPYNAWLETDCGIQSHIPMNYCKHLNDLALELTGYYTKADLVNIYKQQLKYKNDNISQIINKKNQILEKMHSIINMHKPDFYGEYTNDELKNLKSLSIKYTALNEMQKRQNIYTKALETLEFIPEIPQDISDKPYVQGLGVVINKAEVNTTDYKTAPAIIVFNDKGSNHNFCMYDMNILNKVSQFKKKIKDKEKFEELQKLNEEAKCILEEMNAACISKITFELHDTKKDLIHYTNMSGKDDSEDISMIIGDSGQFYYISNFVNYTPKKYANAGRTIAKSMINFLREEDDCPILIKCESFNNGKHSPINLYLRNGFKPYSHTMEEIEEIKQKNKGIFPAKQPVSMYLEKKSLLETDK